MNNYENLFEEENGMIEVEIEPNNAEGMINILNELRGKVTEMEVKFSKLMERMLTEIIALRKENASMKKAPREKETALPESPFQKLDEFLKWESELATSNEKHQIIVTELSAMNIYSVDKFIKTCWRKVMAPAVAECFSWKGTNVKKSAVGLATTAAIRSAFRQKFNIDEEIFCSTSRKYFQYAHDLRRKQKLSSHKDTHIF